MKYHHASNKAKLAYDEMVKDALMMKNASDFNLAEFDATFEKRYEDVELAYGKTPELLTTGEIIMNIRNS